MRPLRLTISAFGPYKNKTVIEMDNLGTNGLYLITGDTGAGKTTIFDAITYALYGEPSGTNRSKSMLRSKYAEPDIETFVELEFKYFDKTYKIRRSPAYERPSKRGMGTTKQPAKVELDFLDSDKTVHGSSEVEKEIREIMGIDRNQFSQIAMIAQGDFLKLLLAKTEDRIAVFRKIFKTDFYEKLQRELNVSTNELRNQCSSLRDYVNKYVCDLICSGDNMLEIELTKAKKGEIPIDEIINLADKIIEQDIRKEKLFSEKQTLIQKEIESINNSVAKAKEREKQRISLENYKKLLSEQAPALEKAKNALKAANEYKSEIEKLAIDIPTQKERLNNYDELETKQKELADTELRLTKLIENHKKGTERDQNEKNRLEQAKKDNENLKDISADEVKLNTAINDCTEKLKNLSKLTEEISELKSKQKLFEASQKNYLNAQLKADSLTEKYTRLNREFLSEQAGILASELKDGLPCPVCGSVLHPNLAKKSENAPSEAELKTAKQQSDAALEEAKLLSEKAGKFKGEYNEKKKSLDSLGKEFFGEKYTFENLNNLISEENNAVHLKKTELQTELENVKGQILRKKKLEKEIAELEESQKETAAGLQRLSNEISEKKGFSEEVKAQINKIKESLEFESKKAAEENIAKLTAKKTFMENSIKNSENKLKELEQKITELNGNINALNEQIKDAPIVNITQQELHISQLKQQEGAVSKELKLLAVRIEKNKAALSGIKTKSNELSKTENEYIWHKALSDTANGQVNGKEKIQLETYVQMHHFDRIIEHANTRLLIMTNGQYELIRRKEADNFRSQSGLELDVIDHYNGTSRSVNSLSGGESFKASLSLALGLSDEIQSSAGGIKLDTMFVDEGFGSLDEESLRQAIKALSSLTEGNRLVGIISHVAELKDKIDKQIVVRKDKSNGSFVEIIE